jgi:integrase/recombinase XerD
MEYMEEPLGERVKCVKQSKVVLPKDILTKRELLKIFKQPDTGTPIGYRNRVCFELLYATGMRRQEMAHLKISNINFKEKVIHIEQGKGQKDRVVPVCDTAMKWLSHYVKYIRPKLLGKSKNRSGSGEQILFLTANGCPIKPESLGETLMRYIEKAKLKKRIRVHSFRHTIATHLLQKGMPLRHVQELLGHEMMGTTTRYLQLSIKDLQREYRKTHPRERRV